MAKLVVWGRDRDQAIRRALRALDEYRITGVATTIPAHRAVLNHPTFQAGEHHTRFMEDEVDLSEISFATGTTLPSDEAMAQRAMTVEVGGRRFDVTYWSPDVRPQTGAARPALRPPTRTKGTGAPGSDRGVITAPMQGTIVKISANAGEKVKSNQTICILEAMKMEKRGHEPHRWRNRRTPRSGRRYGQPWGSHRDRSIAVEAVPTPKRGGEKQTLLAILQQNRAVLIWKLAGMDDERARLAPFASDTSAIGLLQHLTIVERSWFEEIFAGKRSDVRVRLRS